MLAVVKHSISDNGIELIKKFEGFRAKAYIPVPGDVLTIGYGHTSGVQASDKITEREATEYLKDDLIWAEAVVHKYVRIPITQGQHDALVSFVFNIGESQFSASTLLKELNKGNYESVDHQLMRWIYSSGVKYPGLVRRRKAEALLFDDYAPQFIAHGKMPQTCETCTKKKSVVKTVKESRKAKGAVAIAGIGGIDGGIELLGKGETLANKFQSIFSGINPDFLLPIALVGFGLFILYLQHDDKRKSRAY